MRRLVVILMGLCALPSCTCGVDEPPDAEASTSSAEVERAPTAEEEVVVPPPVAPPSEERTQVEAIAKRFVEAGADHPAIFASLKPTPAELAAIFDEASVGPVSKQVDEFYETVKANLSLKPTQTEVIVGGGKIDVFRAGTPTGCPTAYKAVAEKMKPGLALYCFSIVEPGQKKGTTIDALIKVGERWVFVPKPFRVIR